VEFLLEVYYLTFSLLDLNTQIRKVVVLTTELFFPQMDGKVPVSVRRKMLMVSGLMCTTLPMKNSKKL
jgi:hypothetical protein